MQPNRLVQRLPHAAHLCHPLVEPLLFERHLLPESIPHRIVVGERGLKNGVVEYKTRRDADATEIAMDAVLDQLPG